jgi:hypothetical protein
MEDGTLKVMYNGELNTKLDEALKKCIEKFDYKWYAQGTNLITGVRDIVFEKKGK